MAHAGRSGAEIRALTGLRLIAAVWVVAHHFWLFSPRHPWLDLLSPVAPLLKAGWLGVDLFFVLSGFVLGHNYVASLGERLRPSATARFYWARVSRIWPTWLVVLAAVSAGLLVKQLGLGAVTESRLDAPTMLRQVLLIQVWDRPDYSATGPVGPGWSLSAEWLAYLLFPALALVLYRLRRCRASTLGVLALASVAPFAYRCLELHSHDWAWSWLMRLAGCFLAGALVALCVQRLPATRTVSTTASWTAWSAVALVVLTLWWAAAIGHDAGVVVLCFPVLVGALAVGEGTPARWLSTPAIVLGGRVSFALYLVHVAVFEAFWTLSDAVPALGGDSAAATLLQIVVWALPLPLAWALWRFVEEPARRRMRGLRLARPARPGAPGHSDDRHVVVEVWPPGGESAAA